MCLACEEIACHSNSRPTSSARVVSLESETKSATRKLKRTIMLYIVQERNWYEHLQRLLRHLITSYQDGLRIGGIEDALGRQWRSEQRGKFIGLRYDRLVSLICYLVPSFVQSFRCKYICIYRNSIFNPRIASFLIIFVIGNTFAASLFSFFFFGGILHFN